MKKQNVIRLLSAGALALTLTALSISPRAASGIGLPARLSDDTAPASEASAPVSREGERIVVSENDRFVFSYDEAGADIYITDKRTGKVWSNTVDTSYYTEEVTSPNLLTQLMTVRTATEEGTISQLIIFDRDSNPGRVRLAARCENSRLELTVELPAASLSFTVNMWIDEDGFNYEIPEDSIREDGTDMLVSIQMMPMLGASVTGEDGYILLPDGSGGLIDFPETDSANAQFVSYPIYGPDAQDVQTIRRQEEQDIYNIMLPLYGIRQHDGALMAAITEGSADASVCVAPGGYQLKGLYRAYFSFNYRMYYSSEINGQTITQLIPYRNAGTRRVKIFIFAQDGHDYSDMAVAYRSYLEQEGLLTRRVPEGTVPLAVDLFMGATENGILGKKFISATTYEQAAEIAADLKQSIGSLQLTLLGWGKGGSGMLPTALSAEGKLGGMRALNRLVTQCTDAGIPLYLNMDFLNADEQTGDFNKRSDVIRYSTGQLVQYDSFYLLNPVRVMQASYEKAAEMTRAAGGARIAFESVGELLYYDYSKANPTSRQQALAAYQQTLEKAAGEAGGIAVSGGNQYVLPFASMLREIPDTHSDYFIETRAVPFYQMVVHGYVSYCSFPGNQAYDFRLQKLKWIETGSIPYFLLTYDNPVKLSDSNYQELFSSQYSVWKETVVSVAQEFETAFSDIWSQRIMSHHSENGLAELVYEDGTAVCINYTDKEVRMRDVVVPALDYRVVSVKEAS